MKDRQRSFAFALALALAICSTKPMEASPIFSIAGSNDTAYVLGTPGDQILVESWTSANSYSSVAITFDTDDEFIPPTLGISGTAYLMTQIGPGTTTANQVGTTTFTTNTPGISSVLLFPNLSLEPNTYFLVLTGASDSRPWLTWEASNPQSGAIVTAAPGVTWTGEYFATAGVGSIDPSYAPASVFEYVGTGGAALNLHLAVLPTPEPASAVLLIFPLSLFVVGSRLSGHTRSKQVRDKTWTSVKDALTRR